MKGGPDILLRPDSPPPHPGDSRASLDNGSKVDLAVADGSDAAAALAYAPLLRCPNVKCIADLPGSLALGVSQSRDTSLQTELYCTK